MIKFSHQKKTSKVLNLHNLEEQSYLRTSIISFQSELFTLKQELLDLLHPTPDVAFKLGHRVLRLQVLPGVLHALDVVRLRRVVLDQSSLVPDQFSDSERAREGSKTRQKFFFDLKWLF